MPGREGKGVQLTLPDPPELTCGMEDRSWPEAVLQSAEKGAQGDPVFGVIMDYCGKGLQISYLKLGFLCNFPDRSLLRRFSFPEPSAGQLP